jgi:hypothetical protein
MEEVFQPGILPGDIKHVKPALTVWAVRLVADFLQAEGQKMVHQDSGLHLHARAKASDE